MPLYAAGILVLAGILAVSILFKRRAPQGRPEPPPAQRLDESAVPDTPPVQAELIDADNIVSAESLSIPLDKSPLSIGRDSGNDIVIAKESVSSLHATIEYKNGYFYLEDHRSTNGTRLNDKKIAVNNPVRLKSGDKIHFANYEFRFLLPDQAPLGETVMLLRE